MLESKETVTGIYFVVTFKKTLVFFASPCISFIINNLDDEVKYELFALPDYNANSKDMDWIIATLIQMNKTRTTIVTPLHELMKIRQTENL